MNQAKISRSPSPDAASGAVAAILQFVESEVAKICAAEVARTARVSATRH